MLSTISRLPKPLFTRNACRARYLHFWALGGLRTEAVCQHATRPVRHANPRRAFSSTTTKQAALTQQPTKETVLLAYPSPSSMQGEDEYADESDIEFVSPGQAKLEITDRAAEVCMVCPWSMCRPFCRELST